jgi:hypothetical protein
MNNDQLSSINRVPLADNADFTCVSQPILSMCSAIAASGSPRVATQGGSHYQNNISYSGTEMNFAPDALENARRRHTMKNEGFRQFQKLLRLAEAASCNAGTAHSPVAISIWSKTNHVDETVNILSEKNMAVLERLATDHRTPTDVLARLAQHPDADLRSSLSDNKSTPKATVWALAQDSDPNVRYQLAENPHLPIELLMTLRDDDHPYVACRAARTISRLQAS